MATLIETVNPAMVGAGVAAEEGEPVELERQHFATPKSRLRGLGKLWASATR